MRKMVGNYTLGALCLMVRKYKKRKSKWNKMDTRTTYAYLFKKCFFLFLSHKINIYCYVSLFLLKASALLSFLVGNFFPEKIFFHYFLKLLQVKALNSLKLKTSSNEFQRIENWQTLCGFKTGRSKLLWQYYLFQTVT